MFVGRNVRVKQPNSVTREKGSSECEQDSVWGGVGGFGAKRLKHFIFA